MGLWGSQRPTVLRWTTLNDATDRLTWPLINTHFLDIVVHQYSNMGGVFEIVLSRLRFALDHMLQYAQRNNSHQCRHGSDGMNADFDHSWFMSSLTSPNWGFGLIYCSAVLHCAVSTSPIRHTLRRMSWVVSIVTSLFQEAVASQERQQHRRLAWNKGVGKLWYRNGRRLPMVEPRLPSFPVDILSCGEWQMRNKLKVVRLKTALGTWQWYTRPHQGTPRIFRRYALHTRHHRYSKQKNKPTTPNMGAGQAAFDYFGWECQTRLFRVWATWPSNWGGME